MVSSLRLLQTAATCSKDKCGSSGALFCVLTTGKFAPNWGCQICFHIHTDIHSTDYSRFQYVSFTTFYNK